MRKSAKQEVTLIRREVFCASHRLHAPRLSAAKNRRIFGKCNSENGHGHNYVLEISVKGSIDARTGMVMNLADLKAVIHEKVMARVDHKHLNLDVAEFKRLNPTAENIALTVWGWLRPHIPKNLQLSVLLRETENNSAIYSG